MERRNQQRELILAPNEYAYVLDTTKGHINAYVGPNKTSLAQTDQIVAFNEKTKRFESIPLQDAVCLFATAPANWYVVLKNPAGDGKHPTPGIANSLTTLRVGRKVIIPGPASFPLWPGQMAKIIEGHRLRSNEYLLVQVYDAQEAMRSWRAVLGLSEGVELEGGAPTFQIGEKLVIRGSDVKFYLPPSGVEVIPDRGGHHTRRAVTLGRLEYCILIGEDGRKRYIRGEAVVFPKPGQVFVQKNGSRRFQAVELSDLSGLHIKAIAPYTDSGGVEHREGAELFITGEGVIYFPRQEHALISHGGKEIHRAVVIPEGEGRYVLNRRTGEVSLRRGPCVYLPDPRQEVLTRRVLSDRECALLFPGNEEALAYNRGLRSKAVPKAVSKAAPARRGRSRSRDRAEREAEPPEPPPAAGFDRPTSFEEPMSMTLANRYAGAVRVEIWSGFAVEIIKRSGSRRVASGPTSILLEYDEILQPLSLSMGTPKSEDRLLHTVFLQVSGNKVSDEIEFLSGDLVRGRLKLTYRVNFEGDDPSRWFAVDNYIKLLCDRARSMLKSRLRRETIRSLQSDITVIVRDLLLGAKPESGSRRGLLFPENNLRVYDVDVLDLSVADEEVRQMLSQAQLETVRMAIEVATRNAELDREQRLLEITRATARDKHATALLDQQLTSERAAHIHTARLLAHDHEAALAQLKAELALATSQRHYAVAEQERATRQANEEARLSVRKAQQELQLQLLRAQVAAAVETTGAIQPGLVEALTRLGDQELLSSLSQNFGELAAVEGRGLLKTAQRFLDFVPTTLMPTLNDTASPGEPDAE